MVLAFYAVLLHFRCYLLGVQRVPASSKNCLRSKKRHLLRVAHVRLLRTRITTGENEHNLGNSEEEDVNEPEKPGFISE